MSESISLTNQPEDSQPTRLNVVFVDQAKDATDAARLAAEARLTDELAEHRNFFGRLYNGVVKGNLLREYYILRYQREAGQQIDQENDVLLYEADEAGRVRAEQSLIDRFQSEYDNEVVIHEEAGEKRNIIGSQSELANEIKELIRQNVAGELSNESLEEEKGRVLQAFAEHSDEYRGLFQQGRARVDNMLDIARAVQNAVEHGESLDMVLSNLQITVGEARSNVRTEVQYNRVDRVIERLQGTRIGALVGPEVVATAATLATSILRMGSHRAVGAALMTLTPAAGAALWAGLRENKRTKEERTQHSREMAQGKIFEQGSRRREEMEAARYETVSAQSLIDELRSRFSHESQWQSDEEILDALATLSAAEARIRYSDSNMTDLVSYSSVEAIGDERLALDIARAEAKTIAQSRLDTDIRRRLGIEEGVSIAEVVNSAAQRYIDTEVLTDVSAKDRAFRRLKATRVARAAATGAVTGLVFGAAAQEGIAALDGTREGLVEQLWQHDSVLVDEQQHNTLLYGLIHGDSLTGTIHSPSGNYAGYFDNRLQVPDDYQVITTNGELQIVDPTGKIVVENIPIGQDGELSSSSIDALKAVGIDVDTQTHQVGTASTEEKVKVKDYIKAHKDEFTRIKRDFWYDNDTPSPKFDKNELGLWKGGVDGSGIAKNGHYRYTVAHMTEGGSYHNGHKVSWSELAQEGKLKAALSVTRGTQTTVLMVDIAPDGRIDIEPDSLAGQLFENDKGEVNFKGAYMEIVEVNRTDAEDLTHVRPLATITGEKSIKYLTDIVSHDEFETVNKLTPPDYEVQAPAAFTEMAPVIPVIARRPLEALNRQRHEEGSYGYYGNEAIGREEFLRVQQEISPRLRNNPDSVLRPRDELDWYRSEVIRRRGRSEVEAIETQIKNNPQLQSLSSTLKTVVTIPVAATQEADNIYHTLSLYGQQDVDAQKSSAIMINLNWLDTTRGNADQEQQIALTRQEIERAQRDFPDLTIAVVENEYDARKAESTGGVIGYVARDLIDTALLAIQQKMASGDMSDDQEVLVIRNDADMQGMSRHHLAQFQKMMQTHTMADILKGVTRFGVRASQNYPGFSIVSSFSAGLSLLNASRGNPHTGGANFGIKASTLAAIGGLGDLRGRRTGAGSDDVALGRRISVARRVGGGTEEGSQYGSSYVPMGKSAASRRSRNYVQAVVGANIDTNPDRLIPYYLENRSFQEAWGRDGFDNGAGGYKPRRADASAMDRTPKESSELGSDMFKFIETNISKELSWSSPADTRRMLALWFGAVPGAYTVTGTGRNIRFILTDAGKKYLKNRIERESDGKFGPYGRRKMRQLYGEASGKRKPVHTHAPLVAPL